MTVKLCAAPFWQLAFYLDLWTHHLQGYRALMAIVRRTDNGITINDIKQVHAATVQSSQAVRLGDATDITWTLNRAGAFRTNLRYSTMEDPDTQPSSTKDPVDRPSFVQYCRWPEIEGLMNLLCREISVRTLLLRIFGF